MSLNRVVGRYRWWLCLPAYLIGIGIALWAPEDVFSRMGPLMPAYNLVASVIPSVRAVAQGPSAFPQVAALYYAFMWCWSPLFWVLSAQSLRSKDSFLLRRDSPLYRVSNLSVGERAALLVAAGLFAGLVGFFVVYYDGRDILFFPFGTSRRFLAFAGVALPISAAGLLAIALTAFRRAVGLR